MIAGPWIILACILGVVAFALPAGSALGARLVDVDSEAVRVIPFCPALLITGWLAWTLLRSGIF